MRLRRFNLHKLHK